LQVVCWKGIRPANRLDARQPKVHFRCHINKDREFGKDDKEFGHIQVGRVIVLRVKAGLFNLHKCFVLIAPSLLLEQN